MESLIIKAKAHTNKLAVSGVIKRYDGKVNNHKIDQYNKLVNDLCSKHKIIYNIAFDACDVTLSVYPQRASLKNMHDHGGNRTYDLWITSQCSAN